MRIEPPRTGEPRRPHGPRDPGDAWVIAPSGERYWGRFGAAGLLALDGQRGVLLQHRAAWSHFGDTWGLPGGARHQGEDARDAALREAAEEAGVPTEAIRVRLLSVADLGYWSYTTVVGDVVRPFDPTVSDPESRELAWVRPSAVAHRPLHPGFARSWRQLQATLATRPAVVVDAANVVGAVPDGWWNDRVGAAERLLGRIAARAARGVPAAALDLPHYRWFPTWTVVLEGAASAALGPPGVSVVRAPHLGDNTLLEEASRLAEEGSTVTVVTSDRELGRRAAGRGARVVGARWLLGLTEAGLTTRPGAP